MPMHKDTSKEKPSKISIIAFTILPFLSEKGTWSEWPSWVLWNLLLLMKPSDAALQNGYFKIKEKKRNILSWLISCVYRAVASLTVPGGREFHFLHFFLKFRSILLSFPQTLHGFFLILALRVGESTREGPGYATECVTYVQPIPLSLKGLWTTADSYSSYLDHVDIFQEKWYFFTIKSVYLCCICMLSLTCMQLQFIYKK